MPSPVLNRIVLSPSLDPVTIDYRNRISANGGSISNSSLRAINAFVRGCSSDGIWDLLLDVGVFAGNNLNSALVKLKYRSNIQSNLSNFNFIESDYSELTGLRQSGTKHLKTGFGPSAQGLNLNNAHLSFYSRSNLSTQSADMGVYQNNNQSFDLQIRFNGSFGYNNAAIFSCFSVNDNLGRTVVQNTTNSLGFYCGSATNGTNSIYKNGVLLGSSAGLGSVPSGDVYVGGYNDGGQPGAFLSGKTFSFYSIGLGINSEQQLSLYNCIQKLQQSLNRAV